MIHLDIKLNKTGLFRKQQNIEHKSNILTLIGENGCGKSSILEYLFHENLSKDERRIIAFSSGQNELFSKIFNSYKYTSKRYGKEKEEKIIRSFFLNKDWTRLIIFLANFLVPEGQVRNYLLEKDYVVDNEGMDKSTRLVISFRMRKYYIDQIRNEIETERNSSSFDPDAPQLRKTIYFRYLEKLARDFYSSEFDWETTYNIKTRRATLTSRNVYDLFDGSIDEIFTFLSKATHGYDSNIILEDTSLYFREGVEMIELSDGEYQLLCVYSILDLFDDDNTLFLLDEIDAHVHYLYIQRIWRALDNIKGKTISTTHLSDSILSNKIENIRLVNKGKIEQGLPLSDIASRISNLTGTENYIYELASKAEYIALIDDVLFDWTVFTELAKRKLGDAFDNLRFSEIIPIKCTSGYHSKNQTFADDKQKWIDTFEQRTDNAETKYIFMVCDRDLLLVSDINEANKVTVNGARKSKQGVKWKEYTLSWRRREIENYLLSYSLLSEYDTIIEKINSELLPRNQLIANAMCDNCQVQDLDVKKVIQPIYLSSVVSDEDRMIDVPKLREAISRIPQEEISDDIKYMYDFLINKINV